MKKILYLILSLAFMACAEKPAPVDIVRLDEDLARFAHLTKAQQLSMIDSLNPELQAFFQLMGEEPTDSNVLSWSKSRAVEVFQPDVDKIFPSLSKEEKALGYIIAKARKDSLDFDSLRFCAVTWGFNQSVMRNDDFIYIALNHYLGADYPGYSHLDYYLRRQKTPEMIQYNVVEAIISMQFPFDTDETPTLLNRMLYEGAIIEAQMSLINKAQLDMALGYTTEELEIAEDNTRKIWEEMTLGKYVHSTDPMTVRKLISPSPVTPFLGGAAPGRIGRYIGYKIVREYMQRHSGTTLRFLLSKDFYASPQSLIASGF